MSWINFRQLKGQTVQDYTQEFRKRALLIGVNLQYQDTPLKYIGGLHSYLKHTILMFNQSDLDEVFGQARHLEARGKQGIEEKEESEGKGKGKFMEEEKEKFL